MTHTITPTLLTDAADKACRWLVSQMRDDGSYAIDSIGVYYKLPYPLRICGQSAASSKLLQYVTNRFMTERNDFVDSPDVRTCGDYGVYTSRFCNSYPNFWFLRAAVALNRFDLAHKIFSCMTTFRNPQSGACRSLVDPSSQRYDANSTACGCIACLMMGQIDSAAASAAWLIGLFDRRADKTCYHVCQDPDGCPVTQWPEGEDRLYVVRQDQPDQYSFTAGMAMVALAKTFEATQDRKYLNAAIGHYEFLTSCCSDVDCSAPAGKLGWGAAILYRHTGEARYLKTAQTVMQFILGTLTDEGYVLMPRFAGRDIKSIEDQGLALTCNWTAEYATWLADAGAELAATHCGERISSCK